MPLNYLGDAVTFLLKAKGIAQGEWIHGNSQVGMPFGADFRDFPLNITWDSAILWVISFGTKNAGLMLNLYWLFAIVAAAVTALTIGVVVFSRSLTAVLDRISGERR